MSGAWLDLHATTVWIAGRAVLIEGPSGSGKSGLALDLIGRGAGLIADDRTRLADAGTALLAKAPPGLPAAIEARGVGLICIGRAPPAPLLLIVDMGCTESARLPEPRWRCLLGHKVALLHKFEGRHFAAAILQYVKSGGELIR